jgi:hypothetical protein
VELVVRVMHDYRCHPLWVRRGPDLAADESPHELGLSASLCGRLEAWRSWGESFLNVDDPHDSRAVSDEEDAAFDAEGRLLASRVADELPGAVVHYWKDGEPAGG